MDLTKIKIDSARQQRHAAEHLPECSTCEEQARAMADKVPDLITEIERLNSSPLDPGFDLSMLESGNDEGCADPNDVEQAIRLVRAQQREIDRLRGLAREGWERARDQANAARDDESEAYAVKMLAKVEAKS